MKILFICLSTLKFNARTPLIEPLGGTESAMCYLSVALAQLGHDVILMRNGPEETIDGVLHIPVSEDIAHLNLDIVIAVSAPQAAPGIKKILPDTKLIVWSHMLPDQPAMLHIFQKEIQNAIDHVVYVSARQQSAFISASKQPDGLLGSDAHVINNGIAPCFENLFSGPEEILAAKKCRGAYTSTPFRGLAILSHIKELPIDIFSSMRVYQGEDTAYETMYNLLKANDCLELHGSVSQTYLAMALKNDAFLVYPSIFAECNSIAILEAMAAGMKVITTETASEPTDYIDVLLTKDSSLEAYILLLRKNINKFRAHPEEWARHMWQQVQYVNREYTWAKKALEWQTYLQNVLAKPT